MSERQRIKTPCYKTNFNSNGEVVKHRFNNYVKPQTKMNIVEKKNPIFFTMCYGKEIKLTKEEALNMKDSLNIQVRYE